MTMAAAAIQISGSVQGVGYRYFCYQKATNLDLNGWVKNNPDRTVSLYVEGERAQIDNLLDLLKKGPPASDVGEVTVDWVACKNQYMSFEITY